MSVDMSLSLEDVDSKYFTLTDIRICVGNIRTQGYMCCVSVASLIKSSTIAIDTSLSC